MPHPTDVQVGANIRSRREHAGMPQKELAKRLGISFQQVQKYESGNNRVSCSKLADMCHVFGCQPTDMFDGVDLPGRRTNGAATPPQRTPNLARARLDLARSFDQIPSRRVQRNIVQLTKALAETAVH